MKIKELQSILEKKRCGMALFYSLDSSKMSPNLFYFSGYDGLGALVVPEKSQPFLITPEMEFEKAMKS